MDDPAEDLGMLQLADSLFPSGLFAASNGLESLFLDGTITTAGELAALCRVYIEQQVGPCDCVAFANAYDAAAAQDHTGMAEIDAAYCSMRAIRETREAAIRSGAQVVRCVAEFQDDGFLRWYHNCIKDGTISGIYPVSLAVCCRALGIKKHSAILVLLYGFVAGSVGAALRLGMIQHFEGQRIIHELKPSILGAAGESSGKTVGEMWQFAPQAEINQMAHERRDSKMFIT